MGFRCFYCSRQFGRVAGVIGHVGRAHPAEHAVAMQAEADARREKEFAARRLLLDRIENAGSVKVEAVLWVCRWGRLVDCIGHS